MVKLVDRTYGHFSIESQQWPGNKSHEIPVAVNGTVNLTYEGLFIFRRKYLEDLLYFYFRM